MHSSIVPLLRGNTGGCRAGTFDFQPPVWFKERLPPAIGYGNRFAIPFKGGHDDGAPHLSPLQGGAGRGCTAPPLQKGAEKAPFSRELAQSA